MIYKFHITHTDENIYLNVPDNLNQKLAIKVAEMGEFNDDQNNVQKYAVNEGPADLSNLDPEVETVDYAGFIHPNLFIHEDDETNELKPDMKYFEIVDRDFFEKMMDHWSSISDYSIQSLLDRIEKNGTDYLVDSATITDIII